MAPQAASDQADVVATRRASSSARECRDSRQVLHTLAHSTQAL
jgi:hypothetical protein